MRSGGAVMRGVAIAILVLVGAPAGAQTPPTPQAPLQRELVARFQEANTTHDGRLTLAQAQAGGLGWIVRHFGEVDSGTKGYVTLADLQAYRAAHPRDAAASPAGQPGQTGQPGLPGPGVAMQRQRFLDRFAGANTTGDGRLTLAQATAGHMPNIARHFAAIDTGGKGYVTLADIQAWRRSQRGDAATAAPAAPSGPAMPQVARPGAATQTAAGSGSPDGRMAARQKFAEKFQAANITGDGRLTLAQAQAGRMPMVAKNFAAIDTGGRGYVTIEDIRAYRRQVATARQAGPAQP